MEIHVTGKGTRKQRKPLSACHAGLAGCPQRLQQLVDKEALTWGWRGSWEKGTS